MIEWGEVDANKLGRLYVHAIGFTCVLTYWRGWGKWKLTTSIPLLSGDYDLGELKEIIAKIEDLDRRTQAGEFDHLLGGKQNEISSHN